MVLLHYYYSLIMQWLITVYCCYFSGIFMSEILLYMYVHYLLNKYLTGAISAVTYYADTILIFSS